MEWCPTCGNPHPTCTCPDTPAVHSISLTTDECHQVRYALNELANRRQSQGVDRKAPDIIAEAIQLRRLAMRFASVQHRDKFCAAPVVSDSTEENESDS